MQAESALKATDHYVALGNIESARGRIVRRAGEYTKALEHFGRAIAIYAKRDSNHRNLARALVNAAYVRRLLHCKSGGRSTVPLNRDVPAWSVPLLPKL